MRKWCNDVWKSCFWYLPFCTLMFTVIFSFFCWLFFWIVFLKSQSILGQLFRSVNENFLNCWSSLALLRLLQFKSFELHLGGVFFKIYSHISMFFENSILSSDIGHAEARIGAKKTSGVEFSCSYLQVEWKNGLWTKICFHVCGIFAQCFLKNFCWDCFFLNSCQSSHCSF